MNINYDVKNTSCYDTADGSITIKTIELTTKEIHQYGKYTIQWSNNISSNQINSCKLFAHGLKADKYAFRIVGNGNTSEWYNIEIKNISPISISNLVTSNDPCAKIASMSFDVKGGKPPYAVKYGNQYLINQTSKVSIHDIISSADSRLSITDANGCLFEYDDSIDLNFSYLTYRITDIEAPVIHDDHPQKLNIDIQNGYPPFRFDIYLSEAGNKKDIIATTILENTSNTYDLSRLVYPGDYIIDIIDGHQCLYTTEEIHIPNSVPLAAKIAYKNTDPLPSPIICNTEFIFDTILIPFHLLLNDLLLRDWVKNLVIKSEINMSIGKQKYIQKIIKHNKHYSKQANDTIDILHLGPSTTEWYFSINIARGFNLQTDNVFSEMIYLSIEDRDYPIVPELDDSIDTIKLIRGNILTNTSNVYDFKNSHRINIYDGSNYSSYMSCSYENSSYLHNTYQVGNIFGINLLDNTYCNSLIDLNHSANFILPPENIDKINNLKQIISLISNPSKDISVAAISDYKNNGSFSVLVTGGSQNPRFAVYRYDKISSPMNINTECINAINLVGLQPGTYVIKIQVDCHNKLKYINNQLYDNHYESCLSYINDQLGCSIKDINFEYGDILINILEKDSESYVENLPGIIFDDIQTYTHMTKNQINTLSIPSKTVSESSEYTNRLKISCDNNKQCVVTGPNNFSHIFQGNILLINLIPGVYTIEGQDTISEKYKTTTHKIYIGPKSKEYISIS
jgi:hypothetical protein